jgi:hypothetical protein
LTANRQAKAFIFAVTKPFHELPNDADFDKMRLSYGNGPQ